MGITKINPADIDFASLDTPTGCKRGRIVMDGKELSQADIPEDTWVVYCVHDLPEQPEGAPTRTITYLTSSWWVKEMYYSSGKLACQKKLQKYDEVEEYKEWAQDGTLLLEQYRKCKEEIIAGLKENYQVVLNWKYYGNVQIQSELVAVKSYPYGENNPQVLVKRTLYLDDGEVISREHKYTFPLWHYVGAGNDYRD